MNYFHTIRDFVNFATAREFWHEKMDEGVFAYEKNKAEQIGEFLIRPIVKPFDSTLKRIREPYMITALTIAAISSVTLVFYPEECVEKIRNVFPFVSFLKPWIVKLAVFTGTEAIIFGFGTRTLGRLSHGDLITAWNSKSIVAIPLGAVIEEQ